MADKKIRRFVAVAAFAAAAAAAPVLAATVTEPSTDATVAAPECLAWFGNKEDGHCLGYSNGTPAEIGTPQFGYCGARVSDCDRGVNITTGPLLPGQQIGGNFSP